MNRFSQWLPDSRSFALSVFISASPLFVHAEEIKAPPDLWDIATGEQIPGTEVLKTKDFGAMVSSNDKKSLAAKEEIRPGDIVLAVDGLRTYGGRDYSLAQFRNPFSTTMTFLINRKGDLLALKLHDVPTGHMIGVRFSIDLEKTRFVAAVESLGMNVSDDKVRMSLGRLPAQAAAELDSWSKVTKSENLDTAWLKDFIDLYSALQQRRYSEATAPAHTSPIPYFQRLEKFYLTIAEKNKTREVPPEVEKGGEFAEFYVLALPVPDYRPPLGDLKFSDRRFQTLLARRYAMGNRKDSELSDAARSFVKFDADSLDAYLSQVKAALIDPEDQGGWPYRSSIILKAVPRNLLIQELSERMKDPDSPDWTLHAYAMVFLRLLQNKPEQAARAIEDLGNRSPYLARSAADLAFVARHVAKAGWKTLAPMKKVLANHGEFLGPNAPELYRWALKKIQPQAVALGEIKPAVLPDPYALLTKAPYAELAVLKHLENPAPATTGEETSETD